MLTAVFPQNEFRFRIYDNAQKKSWQEIKAETGCHALINLCYFNMATFQHDDAIMVGGEWLREPAWSYYGILIDPDGHLTVGPESSATYDYANAEPIYYLLDTPVEGAQSFGENGATMLGMLRDGSVVLLLASKDDGITSAQGVETLRGMGCKNVLRYDGSWSSQGSLGPGLDVDPSQERKVRSYLLVFKKEKEVSPVDHIKQDFMTQNQCYFSGKTITPKGIMVHSTGTPGLMAQTLRDRWDDESKEVSVHAMVDDTVTIQALPWTAKAWHCAGSGNSTHISFEICEPQEARLIGVNWVAQKRGGESPIPWAIERIQQELIARGYDPKGVDGKFGPGCEAAVKAFQQDSGLAVDGSVGKATLAALAEREGSYMAYDPAETEDYFAAVWDRSVALCAHLCKEYGLDPATDILCHAEGYQQGIANNHADVNHWFPLHGYSMDDFRAAVKLALEGGETPAPADPFRDAVEVLVDAGIITTPAYWTGNESYRTDYVRTLIERCAKKIKEAE